MASALFKAITAIGLNSAAFLQSRFLFSFDTLLQAVKNLSNTGQTNQPTLPCSTSGSPSGSPSGPPSESPASAKEQNDEGDHGSDNTTDMAGAPSSSTASAPRGRQPSVSTTVPARPRIPPTKENGPPPKAPPSDSQLTDGLSRLDLNGTGATSAPLAASHQAVVNGTGVLAEKENGAGVVPNGVSAQPSGPGAGNGIAAGHAPRILPVPQIKSVSQTGEAKETTTIQLDGETVEILAKVETPEQAAERAIHSRFMREALDMARLALRTNETPVGCVLVYKGRVIAKGMNATNVTRNGTRHAELMAISALLSYSPDSDLETGNNESQEKGAGAKMPLGDITNDAQRAETSTWGDVDPKDGHLYPYGQKLHPCPRVDPSVITESTLYVTVEPCVMCASLLRQLKIKKVYFGAVNDKFGGTGGVFRIHMNSPHSTMASAPASPAPQVGKGLARPAPERRPASADGTAINQTAVAVKRSDDDLFTPVETADLPGDGGNVERGYEAEGGWGRDEAVTLLRQFYVQENNRAPVPRKKEGRAARLAALMGRDGHAGGPMAEANTGSTGQENNGTDAPETQGAAAEDDPDDVPEAALAAA